MDAMPPERVFRRSKADVGCTWALVVVAGGFSGLIAVSGLYASVFPSKSWGDPAGALVAGLVSCTFACLCILFGLSISRDRLELYPDRIRIVGLIRKRDVPLRDFGGFRVTSGYKSGPYLLLVPKESTRSTVSLALSYRDQDELLAELSSRFSNSDEADARADSTELARGLQR